MYIYIFMYMFLWKISFLFVSYIIIYAFLFVYISLFSCKTHDMLESLIDMIWILWFIIFPYLIHIYSILFIFRNMHLHTMYVLGSLYFIHIILSCPVVFVYIIYIASFSMTMCSQISCFYMFVESFVASFWQLIP